MLKGLKVVRVSDVKVEVIPLFFGPRGKTITRPDLKQAGSNVKAVAKAVLDLVAAQS